MALINFSIHIHTGWVLIYLESVDMPSRDNDLSNLPGTQFQLIRYGNGITNGLCRVREKNIRARYRHSDLYITPHKCKPQKLPQNNNSTTSNTKLIYRVDYYVANMPDVSTADNELCV